MDVLGWIIGSVALCVVTTLIVPPLISKIASVSYRFSNMDLNEEEIYHFFRSVKFTPSGSAGGEREIPEPDTKGKRRQRCV